MFPSKHLWDGLWAFGGFGLLGLGLGLYLLQRLTRKTLNVKANDLVLHYKKPPLVDSHHGRYKRRMIGRWGPTRTLSVNSIRRMATIYETV